MHQLKRYGVSERFLAEATLYPEETLARVTAQYRGKYRIVTEQAALLAEVSGKLRYETEELAQYPTVGDYVMVTVEGELAVIHRVLRRKSLFVRRAVGVSGQAQPVASNVDVAFLCMSLNQNFSLNRMERYLEIADRHGIGTGFVFFDDCWKSEFALGKQPAPRPFTHNSGWIQSPGSRAADDPAERPRLEKYVKGVMSRFAHDRRIVFWDLYNEPGNGTAGNHITRTGLRGSESLPLLRDVFRWGR